MHAQHGLKIAFWSFGRSRVVAIDSQPLHFAFVNDLLRSGEKLGVFEVIRQRSMPQNVIRLGKNQVVMLGARQFRAPGQLF